jgi:hypothetical protein
LLATGAVVALAGWALVACSDPARSASDVNGRQPSTSTTSTTSSTTSEAPGGDPEVDAWVTDDGPADYRLGRGDGSAVVGYRARAGVPFMALRSSGNGDPVLTSFADATGVTHTGILTWIVPAVDGPVLLHFEGAPESPGTVEIDTIDAAGFHVGDPDNPERTAASSVEIGGLGALRPGTYTIILDLDGYHWTGPSLDDGWDVVVTAVDGADPPAT